MRIRPFILLLTGLFLVLGSITIARAYVPALSPDDVPDLVMVGAEATDYVIQAPKIYYLNNPLCAPILAAPENTEAAQGSLTQTVGRTAVAGMEPREMYDFSYDLFCEPPDEPDIISDIVSDDDYVYWISRVHGGLVRISEDRMIWQSEPPEIVDSHTPRASQLAIVGEYIYILQTGFDSTGLYRIHKSTGASTPLLTGAQVGISPYNFQTDGQYLYWQHNQAGLRNLERYHLGTGAHNIIASGVYGYHPVGGNVVYIGFENVMRSYEHATGNLSAPLYTSDVPAYITSIAADGSALYFVQFTQGGGYTLYRMIFGGTAVILFFDAATLHNLQRHESYLFFLHGTQLKRIRTNAGIAPLTNMRIDGLEITQAIQNDANSVPLVRGKRTVVRLFANSEGAAIPGVQARLYRLDGSGAVIDGPLLPINLARATGFLRVQASPDRDNIHDSFTFFLPPDWIDDPTLRLRAELNPYRFPPEPTYTDNVLTTGTFNMDVSGRLETHFVLFEYESDGARYRPRYREDFLQTLSWIRRAYPLASAPGWSTDPSPGFRPAYRYLFDENLGGNVDGTNRHADCQRRIDLPPGSDGHLDDPSLCAAWYVVCPTLDAIRAAEGLADGIFQVGMVADDRGFPRGWACGRGVTTPSGTNDWGWDSDGSYADWYAGHEIGHSQGRGHPTSGNECGHSASDPGYPWPDAKIGDASYRGFDMGDMGVNPALTTRVYPNEWHDMMSYCMAPGQWISDYTYMGIKARLGAAPMAQPAGLHGGDYLQISGILIPAGHEADVTQLRRWDSLAFTPAAPIPGDYRIRLLNSSGGELAHYDFTPEEGEDTSALLISEFVPFAPGTARVQISHPGSGVVAWEYASSANAPVVSNVELVAPPSPVSGEVTLQWTAVDADGDPLTYDVLYSDDDGVSWQAVHMNLAATSAAINTAELPGSAHGRFQVIANDGLNQGQAMSAAYDVAMKAPVITVLTPLDGQTFAFGQEVYFAAEVYDLQDGDVAGIQWRDQTSFLLGTGTAFSQDNLIIGQNVITVRATNSAGLMTTATFTIHVDDELEMPAATLTVGPDQVGWHVAEGETGLQTATISVSNSGDGTFTVSVSEDAPWLSVSQSGSTTPLQLTLTADPSYFSAGDTVMASLEIVGTADGSGQTVIVPVSLAVGYIDGAGGSDGGGSHTIYLPALLKP